MNKSKDIKSSRTITLIKEHIKKIFRNIKYELFNIKGIN